MADLNDDIKRYISGRMSAAEMHALERKALDDPFLADALYGAESVRADDFAADVEALQEHLEQRTGEHTTVVPSAVKGRGRHVVMLSWPARIAAGFVILISASVLFYLLRENRHAKDLALNEASEMSDSEARKEKSNDDPAFGSDSLSLGAAPQPNPVESSAASRGETAVPDLKKRAEEDRTVRKPNQHADQLALNDAAAEDAVRKDPGNLDPARQAISAPPAASAQSPRAEPLADQPGPVVSDAEAPPAERAELSQSFAYEEAGKKDQARKRDGNASATRDDAAADRKLSSPAGNARASKAAGDAMNIFKGKVVDADGAAIPGVNVLVKGTNTGTVTDIQGNYQLALTEATSVLVFSFIGYANVEERAEAATPLNIKLDEDLTQLSEVVVAGYGVERENGPIESTFSFAAPAGGRRAFRQYLEKHMQYPKEALLNNVEGRVTIQFSVETTGAIGDFRVVKGLGSGCDEEVIRLIKSGPKWSPTTRDDVAEKSYIKVRMKFQLPKEKKK